MEQAYLTTVTPAHADGWVARHQALQSRFDNPLNRQVSERTIEKYATDMRGGTFGVADSAIVIAKDGRILNGQHRLLACIKSRVPFKTILFTGAPDEMFDVIDTGRGRNAIDLLNVAGFIDGKAISGIVRLVETYKRGILDGGKLRSSAELVPNHAVKKFAIAHPEISEAVRESKSVRFLLRATPAGAAYFLFAEKDREAALQFFADLRTGVGMAANDPVLMLREHFIKLRGQRGTIPSADLLLRMVKVWNARCRGRNIGVIRGFQRVNTKGEKITPTSIPILAPNRMAFE